jgi:hypothetical protein
MLRSERRAAILLIIASALVLGCTHKKAERPIDNRLVIRKALWGDVLNRQVADVTPIVSAMVKGNALTVQASRDTLGDPAEGNLKHLRIEWSKDGKVARRRVLEGETLSIPANEMPPAPRLVIVKAIYGDLESGKTIDVTGTIAYMVTGNALSVTPRNGDFGDPAKGQFKQLRVDYTFDGVAKSKIIGEKQPIIIP